MRAARHLVIAGVYGAALWIALAGLDFGHHWDELKLLNSAADSVRTGLLLPRWYNYPSLSFDLVLAATAPEAASLAGTDETERAGLIEDLSDRTIYASWFRLRVRTLFAAVALLAIVWTYAWTLASGAAAWQAVVAGAVLAGSWEVGYHARWIAPDAVLMSLAAATMAALACALRRGPWRSRWLDLAALTAGLALSTKYPGGILLIPVLLVSFLLRRRAGEHVRLVVLFVGVFLATSPGVLLEPGRFWSDLSFEIDHYRRGHGCYSVTAGFGHGLRLLWYLAFELLAPWPPVAFVLSVLAAIGAVHVIVRERASAAVILSVPLLYLAYMSTQRVMIVRNYLIVAPFFAYLAARGAGAAAAMTPYRAARAALAAILVAAFAASTAWQLRAAESAGGREPEVFAREVAAYLAANPRQRFALSPAVSRMMSGTPGAPPANAVADPAGADAYVFLSNEVSDWHSWVANEPGTYRTVSGAREVNFDYYPSWAGPPRVLAVTIDTARKLKVVEPNGIEPSTS